MKINSKAVLITIIFGVIFIFMPMEKFRVTNYEHDVFDCDVLCIETQPESYSGYIGQYGFPFQWTNNGIIFDGIVGVAVGSIISLILFRKKKK